MVLASVDCRAEQQFAYAVRVDRDWDSARPGYEAALRTGAATPFQSLHVVDSWYRAMAGRPELEPAIVSIADGRTGAWALHLPLVRARRGLVRSIGFADAGLIDYNAPVIGSAAPRTPEGAAALWRALRRALPAADLIDFRKMPGAVGAHPNPLALLRTHLCDLNGNVVRTGDDYVAYMHTVLKRVVRKELERSWRVFSRHPAAHFGAVTEPSARRLVLEAIERQQPIRLGRSGKTYWLDRPEAADYYRRLVEADPSGRTVVLTALTAGEEVVAALMGLRSGNSFTMIRISSSEDAAWTNCSPGRLVIERTMAALHREGVREFDFSVGNYDYKRRFGVEPVRLFDLVRPLTPLGLAAAADAHGRAWLRQHPALETALRRVRAGARGEDGGR